MMVQQRRIHGTQRAGFWGSNHLFTWYMKRWKLDFFLSECPSVARVIDISLCQHQHFKYILSGFTTNIIYIYIWHTACRGVSRRGSCVHEFMKRYIIYIYIYINIMPNHHNTRVMFFTSNGGVQSQVIMEVAPVPLPPVDELGTVCNGELPQGTTIVTCDEP